MLSSQYLEHFCIGCRNKSARIFARIRLGLVHWTRYEFLPLRIIWHDDLIFPASGPVSFIPQGAQYFHEILSIQKTRPTSAATEQVMSKYGLRHTMDGKKRQHPYQELDAPIGHAYEVGRGLNIKA